MSIYIDIYIYLFEKLFCYFSFIPHFPHYSFISHMFIRFSCKLYFIHLFHSFILPIH